MQGCDMDNEQLVKSIRQLCKDKNIAISQLESDLNFGAGLISRWSKNSPSIDKIVDIADYFHVSIDEVVGYKQNLNDDFLNKLYEQTQNDSITWENCETMNQNGSMVKQYSDFEMPGAFIGEDDKETSYATCFNNGYIIIYAYHRYDQILNPYNLILFIQPNDNTYLVDQHYTKDKLYSLWIKVLNHLGDEAPDEIKAEDLKNSFVNDRLKSNNKNTISKKTGLSDIQELMSNPDVLKLMEIYNQPAFREMQATLNNPEIQNAIQIANKIQSYFDK